MDTPMMRWTPSCICMCVCVCVYVCMYARYGYTCVCEREHINVPIHTYMIYAYIQTYIHIPSISRIPPMCSEHLFSLTHTYTHTLPWQKKYFF